MRNPFLQDPDYFVDDPARRDHIYLDADEFAALPARAVRRAVRRGATTPTTLLRNRMLNELFHESVPVILHEDDLNAMYFSIENRSPFLDRELFEFSLLDPDRATWSSDGMAKAVLRDAMRGIVPDRILDNRRKVGFNAPILDLLDIDDPEVRELAARRQPDLGARAPRARSRSCSSCDDAAELARASSCSTSSARSCSWRSSTR